MNTMERTKIAQREAFLILKRVVEVLEKHNLKYVLYYGTLLGAIRHQGFIPWDDDVDIAMPREDYEKFKKIAQQELEEKYFVQDVNTDDEYPSLIAKVRNSETTLIERGYVHLRKMNQGIFIDIFVTEAYDNKKANKLRLFLLKVYGRLLLEKSTGKGLHKFVSKFFSRKWLLKAISKNQKNLSKNGSGCYNIIENRFLLEKDFYEEYVMQPFEGVQMRVPAQYDKYLTRCYGDYMQLPSEEKRVPLHSTNHISADISYREYIKNI